MKRSGLGLKIFSLLAVMATSGLAYGQSAPAAASDDGIVKMTLVQGGVANLLSGGRVVGFKTYLKDGVTGEIAMLGGKYSVCGRMGKKTPEIGLDSNASGTIEDNEWRPVPQNGVLSFKVKAASGTEYTIILSEIFLRLPQSGSSGWMGFTIIPDYCMSGTVAKQAVKLVDDNMDGKFTQDMSDSIFIGSAPLALPLVKGYQLGTSHYTLEVAEDGSTVKATPIEGKSFGTVSSPLSSHPAVKGVILVDKANGLAYDVMVSGKTGIPEGTYDFIYAVAIGGKDMVSVVATKETPQFPITADAQNILSLGLPLRLSFSAKYTSADGKITVSPRMYVLGIGNEQYKGKFLAAPTVLLAEGNKKLSSEGMEYG